MKYGNLDYTLMLFDQIKNLKLSSLDNVKKYRNLALMKSKLEPFEKSKLDAILKYGEPNEKGQVISPVDGSYKIQKDKIVDFQNEINPLANEEQEIVLEKIKFSSILKAMEQQPDFELGWNDDDMLFMRSVVEFEG
jgi:hypothetical protein